MSFIAPIAFSKVSELLPTVSSFIVCETEWISHGPKRNQKYREIYQTLENATPKKIPGIGTAHWLARLEAMNVLVEQWHAKSFSFR